MHLFLAFTGHKLQLNAVKRDLGTMTLRWNINTWNCVLFAFCHSYQHQYQINPPPQKKGKNTQKKSNTKSIRNRYLLSVFGFYWFLHWHLAFFDYCKATMVWIIKKPGPPLDDIIGGGRPDKTELLSSLFLL